MLLKSGDLSTLVLCNLVTQSLYGVLWKWGWIVWMNTWIFARLTALPTEGILLLLPTTTTTSAVADVTYRFRSAYYYYRK